MLSRILNEITQAKLPASGWQISQRRAFPIIKQDPCLLILQPLPARLIQQETGRQQKGFSASDW